MIRLWNKFNKPTAKRFDNSCIFLTEIWFPNCNFWISCQQIQISTKIPTQTNNQKSNLVVHIPKNYQTQLVHTNENKNATFGTSDDMCEKNIIGSWLLHWIHAFWCTLNEQKGRYQVYQQHHNRSPNVILSSILFAEILAETWITNTSNEWDIKTEILLSYFLISCFVKQARHL